MSEEKPQYVTDALEMAGINLDEPRRIVQTVSGFTPLFDAVIEQYHDETRAAVHGAVWRYCQMEDGVCKASLSTIAERVGVDVSTASRHIEALVSDGYFVDLTPELRNRPHIYADTGKVVMKSQLIAGVAQSKAGVAQSKAGVAQSKAGVAQSRMNKDSKKDSSKKKEGAAPKANQIPEIVLYREVASLYPSSEVFQLVVESIAIIKNRLGRDVTKDDLLPFRQAWVRKGYNRLSINWLEWAETGAIPQNGTWKSRREQSAPAPVNSSQYELALQQAQSLMESR